MNGLWNAHQIVANGDIVVAGETIPAVFWNAVAKRGPNVWMRQKHLGIWRSLSWDQTATAVQEIAGGLPSAVSGPASAAGGLRTAVRVPENTSPTRYRLLKGLDSKKDQSYVLHVLGQRDLARAMFPCGGYVKDEVRALAREFGLPAVAGLPDVHRRIKTGQRLRVDGATGTVVVLS